MRPTPLRRTIDRIEVAVRWLAISIGVAALILAPTVADATSVALTTPLTGPASQPHSPSAPRLEHNPAPEPGAGEWSAVLQAASAAETGSFLASTSDVHGRSLASYPTPGDAVSQAGMGLLVVLLGVGIAWALLAVTGRLLHRPRQRYWDRAWNEFNHDRVRPGP
jgi:hypothetical protein